MRRCGWRSKTPAPIIPAMMWTRPIWKAETPVNIAARRTCPVNSRARGGVVGKGGKGSGTPHLPGQFARPRRGRREGVEVQRQVNLADRLPQRLPARVPHRLHVPGARQFEAAQPHLGDAMNLADRILDTAVRQAGEADMAVRVMAAELLQPVIVDA